MKAVFFYTLKHSLLLLLFAFAVPVFAQEKDTSLHVNDWINARHFIVTAQTATPQIGRFIQLTTPYDIRISKDTIISFLPYFGRAFVAPINPQDAGLEFTSTDFTYVEKKAKDNEWEITIETKSLRDNYKLFFTIYTNGQAQLQVTSNNRQPIRFDGYVTEKVAK